MGILGNGIYLIQRLAVITLNEVEFDLIILCPTERVKKLCNY
jgi:hypothetical protein